MTFEQWWKEFKDLAKKEHLKLSDKETYLEYFADGDTPEEAIDTELSYADD